MKSKLLSLSFVAIFIFTSCNPREDFVTFYINNELSKDLFLESTINDNGGRMVSSQADVSLLDSETYRRYLLNIVELDVTNVIVTISDYEQSIDNPKLRIGNSFEVQDLALQDGSFTLSDPDLLQELSNDLLNNQSISFSFEGESTSNDTFTISFDIAVEGVFVD